MLISLLLILTTEQDGNLPLYLGRANHARVLEAIAQIDPILAQKLHDSDGPKPLTCSGLMGAVLRRDGALVYSGQRYAVRITGLDAKVSQILQQVFLDNKPTTWAINHHPFQVTEAICDSQSDPWTGCVSYNELAARQLSRGEQLSRQITLDFASPTSFRSQGMHMPIPLPNLVFGSLVERWNSFSTVTFSPDIRQFAEETMAISRYKLESRVIDQKGNSLKIGGIGEVSYVALNSDPYWLAVINTLADFALYSGVGVQTATGMGQCRRIRNNG